MASGVLAVDEKRRITTFNTRAEEITGISSSGLLGKHLTLELLNLPGLAEVVFDALGGREDHEGREIDIDGGEEKIFLWTRTTSLKDDNGQITGAIAIFDDLSKEKIMEAQLIRAERLAALGKFASSLVHEVRNPLVSIKTFFQYLNDETESEEDKKELFLLASQEIIRIEDLLENLLNFAKPSKPELSKTKLSEVFSEVLMLARSEIAARCIRVKTDLMPEVPEIMADKGHIKQVFINLVLNAIQAMPEGGDLVISTDYDKKARLILVRVSDTGVGIPMSEIPRLFEPFYTTKLDGTGMGLAVTYNIINNHNGTIDVASEIGKGTTFTIGLPAGKTA
jgi:two-component system sensor histidine kinase AtoS